MRTLIITLLFLCATSITTLGAKLPRFGVDPVEDVVAAMTLEEKVNLVVGTMRDYIYFPDPAPGMPMRTEGFVEGRPGTAFSEGRVKGAAGDSYAVPRLGIPAIVMADGPAGVRIDATRQGQEATFFCTAFPTGSALAATWDTAVVDSVGKAIGTEARHYGVDILLAPALNIMRSPLCGRNFEYYSEDPLLAGSMAAAYVRGVQSNGVGATLKHYAVNNQETMRNGVDAVVSDRALRDIYLRGFEIAVRESFPMAVMSAYNSINGTVAPENKYLLTDILRGEWDFDGFVMTDWWAEGNGAVQTAAGNDMLMPGTWRQYDEIMNAVKDGTLDVKLLDRNVANILRAFAQTPAGKGLSYDNAPDLTANARTARNAAAQGMVLLKNQNNTLPLAPGKNIALFGNSGYDTMVGGTGSGNVNRAYKVNIHEGLANADLNVDTNLKAAYLDHIRLAKADSKQDDVWSITVADEKIITTDEALRAARDNDAAVFVIGRMAGESADRTLAEGDWFLSPTERANLDVVMTAFNNASKPVIVLMNMGGVMDMDDWNHIPDAILLTWLAGQETGNAVADVLTGKTSPSGRLPMTIARRYNDYPSASNFPHSTNPGTVYYDEDIFVGYRGFDKADIQPVYPFGYGLSYTTFDYAGETITPHRDGAITYDIDITNTGTAPGAEVVQLYNLAPENPDTSRFTAPVLPAKQLVAFAKTRVLQPGETQHLTVNIPADRFSYYNQATKSRQTIPVNIFRK